MNITDSTPPRERSDWLLDDKTELSLTKFKSKQPEQTGISAYKSRISTPRKINGKMIRIHDLKRKLTPTIREGCQIIVFIFIVISTTFRPICPPAFFKCLLNSGTFMELRTTSFIESTGFACSDSVSHDRV